MWGKTKTMLPCEREKVFIDSVRNERLYTFDGDPILVRGLEVSR